MRSLYITIQRTNNKGNVTTHNYREAPTRFHIEANEKVISVNEGTFTVLDIVSPETAARMEIFKRKLAGVSTHA